ncbi:MAG: DUF2283 domain-containing protein [Thaumarchaeota archaeon]|jgi:uncharacterized protein YuzE|nr:DUF2283 domain-containing protein [Candidatus Terraquivivens yellowstonensis]
MDRGSMKVNYDPESDIFYMIIKEGPIKDTIEADNDIFLEIAEDESVAGIEVWNASKNILEPIAKELSAKIKKSLESIAK